MHVHVHICIIHLGGLVRTYSNGLRAEQRVLAGVEREPLKNQMYLCIYPRATSQNFYGPQETQIRKRQSCIPTGYLMDALQFSTKVRWASMHFVHAHLMYFAHSNSPITRENKSLGFLTSNPMIFCRY